MSDLPESSSSHLDAVSGGASDRPVAAQAAPRRDRRVQVVSYWPVGPPRLRPPLLVILIVAVFGFLLLSGVIGWITGDYSLTPEEDGVRFWVTMGAIVFLFAMLPYAVVINVLLHRRARATLETRGVESHPATVVSVKYVERDGSDSAGDYWDVEYRYDVGETARRGSRWFKKRPEIEVGDPVPIVYDPDHPEVHGWLIS